MCASACSVRLDGNAASQRCRGSLRWVHARGGVLPPNVAFDVASEEVLVGTGRLHRLRSEDGMELSVPDVECLDVISTGSRTFFTGAGGVWEYAAPDIRQIRDYAALVPQKIATDERLVVAGHLRDPYTPTIAVIDSPDAGA
ncbi:MAG: hypothetical protein ACI9KE_003887, partial [Polyangiales bacterium]